MAQGGYVSPQHGTRSRGFSQSSGSSSFHLTPARLQIDPTVLDQLRQKTCPVCTHECVDLSVSCEVCGQWFHAGCVKMSQSTYKAISNKPQIGWFCCKCVERKGTRKSPSKQSEDQQSHMMQMMMNRMAETIDRFDRLEEKVVTKQNLMDFEKKVEDMVDAKIEDSLQERLEKEKRRLNLVFVNVKESVGEKEEKAKKDIECVREMMTKMLPESDLKEIKVRNPVRLGMANAGTKPRLLRIEVDSEESKWKIIKNASRLNTGKDWSDPTRQYINLDYTAKEREMNKVLRAQLKEKKENGEKDWRIRNGKLVKVTDGAVGDKKE